MPAGGLLDPRPGAWPNAAAAYRRAHGVRVQTMTGPTTGEAPQPAGGYTGGKRIYRLVFEHPDFDGLIIRARSVSFRRLLELSRIDTSVLGRHPSELRDEDVELLGGLLAEFAGRIVEWNLTDDDDQPIEPTVDSLLDQDPSWVLRVFMVWMTAIAGVPGPLPVPSGSGQQFPGGSVPMAPPSPNPPS